MTILETTPQDTVVSNLDAIPTMDDVKVTAQGFVDLNLSDELLKALSDMNFSTPSSIQAEAIPEILKGGDIIAKAPTGSGKTAAFAIPMLEKLDLNPENKSVQALVLCPTRELAIQVHKEFEKLSKYMENVSVVSVYGGQQIDRQLNALKRNPQIVVATPGRLMDHLRRGSINLELISMAVLDEADEMLDMGFREDIYTILEDTSENRQTVLFSATMEKNILALTKKFQKSPNIVDVTDNLMNTPDIEQQYFEVSERDKIELLTRLLDLHNVSLGLVFCNTKTNVDKVVEILKTKGYLSESLHGDMNQAQREKVMRGFRNGGVEILVATDVAGRGIDIKNIQAVFNYDMPRDDEDYIHRIGRTARAGKSGIAMTFVSKRQVQSLRRIEKANGIQIHKKEAPSVQELELSRTLAYQTKVRDTINNSDLSECINKINAMVNEDTSLIKIAAALLKMSMGQESNRIDENVVFESLSDDEGSQNGRKGRSRNRGRDRDRDRDRSRNGGRSRNSNRGFSENRESNSDRDSEFKFNRNENSGKFGKFENSEKAEKSNWNKKSERSERSEKTEWFGKAEKAEKFGKSEKSEKIERFDKPAKSKKSAWGDRKEKSSWGNKSEKSSWGEKTEKSKKGVKTKKQLSPSLEELVGSVKFKTKSSKKRTKK